MSNLELTQSPAPLEGVVRPRTARPRRSGAALASSIVLCYLYSVFLSPYFSSWVPLVAGFPVGAMIREFALVVFLAYFGGQALTSAAARRSPVLWLYAGIVVFCGISFHLTETSASQFLIGVNTFLAFPAIFTFLYLYQLGHSPRANRALLQPLFHHLPRILIVVAVIGILDVALSGKLVEWLGYNPNYGGEDFVLVTRYYDTVRANAGIGDALAYGYLMSGATIYFLNDIRTHRANALSVAGAVTCSLACFLSLTRGAIVVTLFCYVLFLLSKRGAIFLMVAAMLAAVLVSTTDYGDLYLGRFTDSDEGSARSSELRVLMAEASINFLSENPVGIGIGTQGAGNLLSDTDLRLNTDNYFFHIFLELGLYGGTLFLVYLVWQLTQVMRSKVSLPFKISMGVLFLTTAALSSSIAFATLCVPLWLLMLLALRKAG